jgi:hypothetical protein
VILPSATVDVYGNNARTLRIRTGHFVRRRWAGRIMQDRNTEDVGRGCDRGFLRSMDFPDPGSRMAGP